MFKVRAYCIGLKKGVTWWEWTDKTYEEAVTRLRTLRAEGFWAGRKGRKSTFITPAGIIRITITRPQ